MANETFGNCEIDIVSQKILEIRFVKEAAYNTFQRCKPHNLIGLDEIMIAGQTHDWRHKSKKVMKKTQQCLK